MLRAMLAAVLVVTAFASARGAITRVPQDEPTIQAAIDASVAGDVIRIKAGVYGGTIAIIGKPNLTVLGLGTVVIDGELAAQPAVLVDQSDGIVLKNLRVRRALVGVHVEDSSDVTLIGVRVKEVATRGIHVKTGERVRVEKCIVEGGLDEAIRIEDPQALVIGCTVPTSAGGGIELVGPRSHCVGCKVKDVAGFGIYASGAFALIESNVVTEVGGHGIQLVSPGPAVVRDNTVTDPNQAGISVFGLSITVDRNTIVGAGTLGITVDGDAVKLVDNTIKKSGAAGIRLGPTSEGVVVFKNRVSNAVGAGFDLSGADVVFAQNTGMGNGLALSTSVTNLDQYANQLAQ